jgi:hypothetical protein
MKRFALAFVTLFLSAHALLALPANVTFTSRRGEVFQLILNGRLVNQAGTNHIRLDLLRPGVHEIELRLLGPYDVLRHRAQIVLYEGFETNFVIQVANRRGLVRLRKVGMVPLAFVQPVVPVVPVRPVPPYRPVPPTAERPRYRQPEAPADACRFLVPGPTLERLLEDMGRRQPDSRRIHLARQVISEGGILTDDLRRMLEPLEYEESRVELAQYAYDYVCDKEHFYTLFDLFGLEESVRQLEQHMRRR